MKYDAWTCPYKELPFMGLNRLAQKRRKSLGVNFLMHIRLKINLAQDMDSCESNKKLPSECSKMFWVLRCWECSWK